MAGSGRLNRRGFLLGGAAAAALLSSALPGAALRRSSPSTASGRWDKLARLSGNRLVRPGQAGYDTAAMPNNLRYRDIRPAGVVYCSSPDMVADVLRWCQDYDEPFVIRGGGHSYAGFSSSRDLVIDMRGMRRIDYHADSGRVAAGAGVLNGQIYAVLRRAGRMMTHGRCPTVGVAGFLLGGGIGFNMRRLGLGCDHLAGAEIVTADGRIRALSGSQDSDLFWAIRGGGGGNFGVGTSFTVETVPADRSITVFRMVWRASTRAVAQALFSAADAAPTALGTRISLGAVTPKLRDGGRQVPLTLLGQFAGGKEQFLSILAPVMAIARPEFSDIREASYWDAQQFLLEAGAPAFFRERSAFLPAAPDAGFLDAAFEQLQRWPGTGAHGDLFLFQTGGRVNELAAEATAFVHRSSRWLGVVGMSWSASDAARPEIVRRATDWQDALYADLQRLGGAGAFQNFPDIALADWRERYYGGNLDRLMAVKAAVDPHNFFRFAQSI